MAPVRREGAIFSHFMGVHVQAAFYRNFSSLRSPDNHKFLINNANLFTTAAYRAMPVIYWTV